MACFGEKGRCMGKIKILVAEDEPNLLQLYSISLRETIFERRFATNGKEALSLYQSWQPDIILLDIWMPVMTGYLVLQEIRSARADKVTTIIMATSASNENDIKDCLQFDVQGYILKPFHVEEVSTKIVQYYQQHKSK